jgi:OsmC-like protein
LHHLRPGQHRCRPADQAHRGSLHGHRDIGLNGILGLNADVRNGYEKITVRFTIKGDAPAEKLREIVEQSRARSAVYDVITNGVPVAIEVDTP